MSKIAILTLPLGANYGGILQAFALQHVLREMGHQPITIDRRAKPSLVFRTLSACKGLALFLARDQKRIRRQLNEREETFIYQHTSRFLDKYVMRTDPMYATDELVKFAVAGDFGAYIVGSDQVWRKAYSRGIYNSFLDFVPASSGAKRIAYAASFGLDEWQFNQSETERLAQLAQLFDLITVREESAVGLCGKYLGADAKHVLDPTMLLDRDVYVRLAQDKCTHPSPGNLFCYILDETKEKRQLIKDVCRSRSLSPFSILPIPFYQIPYGESLDRAVLPPVEQWLRSFYDAEMVVTDSFHGTVFSIIFGKECIVIPNADRGKSRFDSLLSMCEMYEDEGYGICRIMSQNPSSTFRENRSISMSLLSDIL